MHQNEIPDNPKEHVSGSRWLRVTFSILFLSVVGSFLSVTEFGLSTGTAIQTISLYGGYLFLPGVLMTLLALVLYQQHRVEQLRFGIGAIIISTAMIALLFGGATTLPGLAKANSPPPRWVFSNQPMVISSIAFLLSLLPVFYLTEAFMAVASAVMKSRLAGSEKSDYSE